MIPKFELFLHPEQNRFDQIGTEREMLTEYKLPNHHYEYTLLWQTRDVYRSMPLLILKMVRTPLSIDTTPPPRVVPPPQLAQRDQKIRGVFSPDPVQLFKFPIHLNT